MTPRDTWRVPVSWLVTCDNHRSHLRTITRRISPHHSPDDPRIVSTLVSLASLHYYPGPLVSLASLHYYPGSRVSDDELLAAICLTWAIVTGLCLGIMSSARTKTEILRRESWDPQADGVSESTGLSVTVITELQCGHRDEHLPESFYHFNLCSFGTKSSELWVWPIVSEDNWWRSAPQPSHK